MIDHRSYANNLRVIVYKIQTLAGHRTSPILLKFGMQSCFRVLSTKWMLKVLSTLENIEKVDFG